MPAGGVASRDDVARLLASPRVVAVACGTAFLLADEAGTSLFNRRLLARGDAERRTVASRGFSGRVARGVATEHVRHAAAPAAYPQLGEMMKAARQELTSRGDAYAAYCLVGAGWESGGIREGAAAQILRELNPNHPNPRG